MATKLPKMKDRTLRLTGLPGVRREHTQAVSVASVTDAIRCLRAGRAVTSAGDEGSLGAWRDDNGLWHGRFSQYRITKSDLGVKSLTALHAWLKEWWPAMGRD